MPHLRPSIGVDALNCQSHHAPGNHHLGRGKAARVEDQRTRHFLAQAASKRLSRKLRQKRILVAQDLASGTNRLADVRVALCHHRHHPVAHIVAQVRNVLVALILPPQLAMHLQIVHELIMREVEQGAYHDVPTAWNAR